MGNAALEACRGLDERRQVLVGGVEAVRELNDHELNIFNEPFSSVKTSNSSSTVTAGGPPALGQ
jgi:hypothetical protein